MMAVEYHAVAGKMQQKDGGRELRKCENHGAVKLSLTSSLLAHAALQPGSSHCTLNFTAARAAPRIARDATAQNRPPPTKRDFQ